MAKRKQRHGVSGNPAKRARMETPRTSASDFLSSMVRPDCSECHAQVRWVTPEEANAAGFDITDGLTWLDSEADDVDIWLCSRWPECRGGGLIPRNETGFL